MPVLKIRGNTAANFVVRLPKSTRRTKIRPPIIVIQKIISRS